MRSHEFERRRKSTPWQRATEVRVTNDGQAGSNPKVRLADDTGVTLTGKCLRGHFSEQPLIRQVSGASHQGYNGAHGWLSPLARNSGPMKSLRRWARAAWARCIARAIRG